MNQVTHSPPSRMFDPEHDSLLVDPPEPSQRTSFRLREETTLYLGLFSLTPLLLIFLQAWAVLPAVILAGLALRTVHKLHRDGVEAILLHVTAWTMVVLNFSVFLLFPPFSRSASLIPYTGTLYSVSLSGLILMPLFALLALRYGVKNPTFSTKQIVGLSAATLHAVGWCVLFIYIGLTGLPF